MERKKLLSLLLVVCMVLSLIPMVASAEVTSVTDTLKADAFAATNTIYTSFFGVSFKSEAVYAGQTAKSNTGCIQLRSNNNNSGIVTTASGGKAKKVSVVWGSDTLDNRTLIVYGKNSAYSQATDLYDTNQGTQIGTIVKGTSTELEISDEYKFIGLRSESGAMYIEQIEISWEVDGDAPPAPKYTVYLDPGEAGGNQVTVENVTTPYTLPSCPFSAPEGKVFDCWTVDGSTATYSEGDSFDLTQDTTFYAQWKNAPVSTFTDMTLKSVPADGDEVVIYYPATSKVMTGEDYYYNNRKHELVAADATLTNGVLSVPPEGLRLTVLVDADRKYTFKTADNKYLEIDGTHVRLVNSQTANTLFQLETAAAGAGNYYIKCDSATYNGNPQYLEFFGGYFTVYSFNGSNTAIYTYQFFSENGETAETYTVTFDGNGGSGAMAQVTDATSPYTLPENGFVAPEGKIFIGWKVDGDDTVYKPGDTIALTGNTTLIAQWKTFEGDTYRLVTSAEDLVAGEDYLIVSTDMAGTAYALSKQNRNNRALYAVTVSADQTIALDNTWVATSDNLDLAYVLTLGGNADDGWTFFDAVNNGYLYAAGKDGSGNYLRTQETNDEFGMFTITFTDKGAKVVSNGDLAAKVMRYNDESSMYSCYREDSHIENLVYLYKKDNGTAPEPKEPSFATQNLVLSGKIGLTFNMDLPEADNLDYTDSYMSFTIPHGTITERVDFDPNRKNRSATLYQFTCYVSTIQMAEPITATFHYKKDGASAEISKIYAVEEYFTSFDTQDADDPAQFSDQIKTLVKATADYGYFVQHYLGEHNTWTLGTDFKEFTKRYTESYSIDASVLDGKEIVRLNNAVDEIDKITYTLVLDSDTTIRVYFKLKTNYSGKFEAKLDSADYTAEKIGTRFAVEINNIAAHELCNSHHIEVTTEKGSAAVDVSALSYVCSMLAGYPGDATAQNAAWAIYSYAKAAEDLLN